MLCVTLNSASYSIASTSFSNDIYKNNKSSVLKYSDVISEEKIKASYLVKFLYFIEWPKSAPEFFTEISGSLASINEHRKKLRLCVLNDETVFNELTRYEGRNIGGRVIDIIQIAIKQKKNLVLKDINKLSDCDIVYLGAGWVGGITPYLAVVESKPILTVGARGGFLEQGGMINFLPKNGHLYFEVNRRAAEQVGFNFRARFLKAAYRVLGNDFSQEFSVITPQAY